jgi:hypothetical protein
MEEELKRLKENNEKYRKSSSPVLWRRTAKSARSGQK